LAPAFFLYIFHLSKLILLDLLLDDSGGGAEAEQEDFLDEDEGSILLLGAVSKIPETTAGTTGLLANLGIIGLSKSLKSPQCPA